MSGYQYHDGDITVQSDRCRYTDTTILSDYT
jgi:hypothetical protein